MKDDDFAKGSVKPPEEVIQLDAGEEVPVLSPAERKELQRSSKGKGKGRKGGGKGSKKGKGKGKGEPQAKPDEGLVARVAKYARPTKGTPEELKVKHDRKRKGQAKLNQRLDREAAFRAAKAEVLQTAEPGLIETEEAEDTTRLTQKDILDSAGVGVARKYFSFDLPYGPYNCSLTRNGAHLLVGGRKGHVAFMHLDSMKIFTELHVKETVRAVQTLHNENLFAVAQKKYTYIYDNQGTELHCIKQQRFPALLDFLPYHFLLVSSGERGEICWRDITHGTQVAEHRTHLGATTCMRQNPKNAVMHLGHNQGLVTLWTPSVKEPVVKISCHNSKVTALAVHGNYMVTAGAEAKWKVWDLRTYNMLHCYGRKYGHAVNSIDVSMTGMVAMSCGGFLDVFKDVFSTARPSKPYIKEQYRGLQIESLRFRPFEDVCCVGHSGGFSSLIVPGAGKANFDSFEANPFETKKQRQEREVQSLLDKLQPDSIMLDPDRIGEINQEVAKAYNQKGKEEEEKEAEEAKKATKKMRGKNKVGNRMKRKALKKGAEQRQKTKDRLAQGGGEDDGDDDDDEDDDDEDEDAAGEAAGEGTRLERQPAPPGVGAALSRFYGKRRRKT